MDEWGNVDSSGGLMTDSGDPVFDDGSVGPGGDPDYLGGMLPVQYGGIAGRMIPGAPSAVGPQIGARGYALGAAAGRGFGYIMAAGRKISVKRMWEIAKRFGPDVAAAMIGYGVADLM